MPVTQPIPAEVLEAFYGDDTVAVDTLHGGEVNRNYHVTAKDGQKTVLQCLSDIWDSSMAEDYLMLYDKLSTDGWDIPRPIACSNGSLYFTDSEDKLWRAFDFIESDGHTPDSLEAPYLHAVGDILGRLHTSLKKIDYTPNFSLAHFHDTDYHMYHLREVASGLSGEAKELADAALVAYDALPPDEDASRAQLIHADPRTSNILFRDGMPYTFIDYDTIMIGSVWVDVGDLLRSMAENSVFKHETLSHAQLQPLIEGYHLAAGRSGDVEHTFAQAISAGKRITLELIARYLADIVDDYYWAWDDTKFSSRAESNLARVTTQWQAYAMLNGDK